MDSPGFQTTAPGSHESSVLGIPQLALALLVLWSETQPERVGEVAFLTPFEMWLLGRGGTKRARFLKFARQLPGQPLPELGWEGCFDGASLSQEQLEIRASAVDVEIRNIGRCRTLVNGAELARKGDVLNGERPDRATLRPHGTILLRGELLLMCVLRPRVLPPYVDPRDEHPFGERDAYGIVGEGPATQQLRGDLSRVAASHEHVLIQGASGTGKELAAKAVHKKSKRNKEPFVAFSAAAVEPKLVVPELFGNLKGYPNPGMEARDGLYGTAERGTLYIDEIGDLPRKAQATLLRALGEGEYLRVGASKAMVADVRAVAATLRDDTFLRDDLRYRFSACVRLPTLRERPEDIPLLIRHLILERERKTPGQAARFLKKGKDGALYPRISARLVEFFVKHELGGNVRELDKLVGAAMSASQGDKVKMIYGQEGPAASSAPSAPPPPSSVKEPEKKTTRRKPPTKEEVVLAWQQSGASPGRAAEALGVSRFVLYRLLVKYGLKEESDKDEGEDDGGEE